MDSRGKIDHLAELKEARRLQTNKRQRERYWRRKEEAKKIKLQDSNAVSENAPSHCADKTDSASEVVQIKKRNASQDEILPLTNVPAHVRQNGLLPDSNVQHNGVLPQANIQQNGVLPHANVRQNGLLPPANVRQNGVLPPANVRQNGLLPQANVQQNGLLPQANVQQNGVLPPANVRQIGLLPQANVQQNGVLPPANVRQNGILPQANVQQNGVLPPANVQQSGLLPHANVQQNGVLPPANVQQNGLLPHANVKPPSYVPQNKLVLPNDVRENHKLQPANIPQHGPVPRRLSYRRYHTRLPRRLPFTTARNHQKLNIWTKSTNRISNQQRSNMEHDIEWCPSAIQKNSYVSDPMSNLQRRHVNARLLVRPPSTAFTENSTHTSVYASKQNGWNKNSNKRSAQTHTASKPADNGQNAVNEDANQRKARVAEMSIEHEDAKRALNVVYKFMLARHDMDGQKMVRHVYRYVRQLISKDQFKELQNLFEHLK